MYIGVQTPGLGWNARLPEYSDPVHGYLPNQSIYKSYPSIANGQVGMPIIQIVQYLPVRSHSSEKSQSCLGSQQAIPGETNGIQPSWPVSLLLDCDEWLFLLNLVLDLETLVIERNLGIIRLGVILRAIVVEELGGLALALASALVSGGLDHATLRTLNGRTLGGRIARGHVELALDLGEAGLE